MYLNTSNVINKPLKHTQDKFDVDNLNTSNVINKLTISVFKTV